MYAAPRQLHENNNHDTEDGETNTTTRNNEFKSENHQSILLKELDRQRSEGVGTDVWIEAGSERIAAHRCIIGAYSEPLGAIVKYDQIRRLEHPEVLADPSLIRQLVDWMYRGRLSLSVDRVAPLYKVAHTYQIHRALALCRRYMMTHAMNADNAVGIYHLALEYADDALRAAAWDYMLENLAAVTGDLDRGLLVALCNCEQLAVSSEQEVFDVVSQWLKNQAPGECCQMLAALPLARLSLEVLRDTVSRAGFVRDCNACSYRVTDEMERRYIPTSLPENTENKKLKKDSTALPLTPNKSSSRKISFSPDNNSTPSKRNDAKNTPKNNPYSSKNRPSTPCSNSKNDSSSTKPKSTASKNNMKNATTPMKNNASSSTPMKNNASSSTPMKNNASSSTPMKNNASSSTPMKNNASSSTPMKNNASSSTPMKNNASSSTTPLISDMACWSPPRSPPSPLIRRRPHKVVYIVGGTQNHPNQRYQRDPARSLQSLELHPTGEGLWTKIQSKRGQTMRIARRFAGAAALGGKLYVVGGQHIMGGNRHYPNNIPDNDNGHNNNGHNNNGHNNNGHNNNGHNNNGNNNNHGHNNGHNNNNHGNNNNGANNNGPNNNGNNNNDLVVAGENLLTSMEVYDGETGTWRDGPPIQIPLTRPAVCVLNGYLYVIGGENRDKSFRTVDRYNPESNTWSPMAEMKSPRSAAGVAVLNGKIYVAGGYDLERRADLSNMEVYGAEEDESEKEGDGQTAGWRYCTEMPRPCSGLAMAALHDCLYALGGGLRALDMPNVRADRYDTLTCQWSSIRALPGVCAWSSPRAIVLAGRLLTISANRFVFAYDVQDDAWESVAHVRTPPDAAVVVM